MKDLVEDLQKTNQNLIEELFVLHRRVQELEEERLKLQQQLLEQRMYYDRIVSGGAH